jgi:hypothetical protein
MTRYGYDAKDFIFSEGQPVGKSLDVAKLEEQNKELTRQVERLRELIIEMCAAKVTTKNGR